MARLHRRYRKKKHKKNPGEPRAPRANPPLLVDLAEFVGPGFAAFAATRFGTRIAATQIAKRKPTWGKHAGALASVGAFFAAWLLAHRIKMLARYHTPIAVGAAIAALQSLIQLYVPRLGWMVADASPELAAGSAPTTTTAPQALPPEFEYVDDDPSAYVYNDSYNAGRYGTQSAPKPVAPQSSAASNDDIDIDLDEGQAQDMGIFGGG